jgi:hypothetical protein
LELDDLKRRAQAQAQAARGARVGGRRSPRLVTSFMALALMLSGGSAVIAGTSGSSPSGPLASASQTNYTPPPEQVVAGERVVPGSARLLAPTGCVARAFNARVAGQNIQKVVFKLDGKRIKTLTAPNAGTRYQIRVNPAKMRIGVHRIIATITYKPATKKKAQNLRISFQRCAKKLQAPRFTG